jgi:hypothetical protein
LGDPHLYTLFPAIPPIQGRSQVLSIGGGKETTITEKYIEFLNAKADIKSTI